MLYVIVNLPARTSFNPFISPKLFDIFHQTKNQSRQELNPYITYETNSEKVNEYIRNVPGQRPSRFLVLEMEGNHRYDIPQQRMEFIHAIHKADFYFGAFHQAIALPKIAKPVSSVPLTLTVNQSKQSTKEVQRPHTPQPLNRNPLSPQMQKMLHLDYAARYRSLSTPKNVAQKNEPSNTSLPRKNPKPVAPRQLPPGRQVRPAPNPVVPQPHPQLPPRVVAPQQEPEVIRVDRPEIPVAALPIPPIGPLSHVPSPDAVLKAKAAKITEKLGEDLPMECTDPITLEPLTDPVEINRRVYNRETLEGMIKEGQFNDPFTREAIDPATAKPAHYMLDAITQHAAAIEGEEPSLLNEHKDTNCIPLKNLFEQWEQMLNEPVNSL
ncbi:hypothetical protein A8135_09765 [Legionella jamestowniensis]|uniref:U-box domain-containing protein n=1 Tax=Legionella jamestowniensis TaxID=455 RepID=A0ABX2XWJ4_9GAMM|nr:U-box domain-containing protein [Legionella jamestowniensis]OCH99022.1 hypothetical protein A8135_09765 [Legionella jamestowniensis]